MGLQDRIEDACRAAATIPTEWSRASPGEQLIALRLSRGVSQRHLAALSGVSQPVISRLERGSDARWEVWRSLYAALGYEVAVVPISSSEEAIDLLSDGTYARELRAEEGRAARWG